MNQTFRLARVGPRCRQVRDKWTVPQSAVVDDQRVGRIVRALRRRRGWRQIDLGAAAGCSQNLVSLVERGHLDRISLHMLRSLLAALDAIALLELRWRGAALDRLLDEAHALVLGAVAGLLRSHGWIVEVEVTYSEYGERGSFDILCREAADRLTTWASLSELGVSEREIAAVMRRPVAGDEPPAPALSTRRGASRHRRCDRDWA